MRFVPAIWPSAGPAAGSAPKGRVAGDFLFKKSPRGEKTQLVTAYTYSKGNFKLSIPQAPFPVRLQAPSPPGARSAVHCASSVARDKPAPHTPVQLLVTHVTSIQLPLLPALQEAGARMPQGPSTTLCKQPGFTAHPERVIISLS